MTATTCTIDGFGPVPVARPTSVSELGELVRQAAARQEAIYPVGGLTQIALGMPPSRPGQAVDFTGLDQVVDFPARDMTITVQTGITMKALRDLAVREKLQLPIDVPNADRATLGGVLATNVSGPRRFGYGTLRDYVIGISAVNDEGKEFKAGGRVVKNVAGYDLCKLLVGSLGTLGLLTQVTLKLRPVAEEQALLCLACDRNKLECILTCLHTTRTRPSCLDLVNETAARKLFAQAGVSATPTPWSVLVGYEGNATAVHWQVQHLVKEVGTQCGVQARLDSTALPLCHALVDTMALPAAGLRLKATLLPSALASFCEEAEHDGPVAIHAHAGSGVVYGTFAMGGGAGEPGLTSERAARIVTAWRARAQAGQGSVIVQSCPSDWKAALDVWGPPRNDAWIMREVKQKFDPRGIFNPGRFVAAI